MPQSAKMTGEQFSGMETISVVDHSTPILYYSVSQKTTPNSCPHLRQVLIDFRHFFTVTLGRKFALKRSLQIQPKIKGVATLPGTL